MIKFYKKKGFTLLELMIVVIIIAILAALAIPRFTQAVAQARRGAAMEMLSSIRSAQIRYYALTGGYTQVLGNLDISMTAGADWTVDTTPAGTPGDLGGVTHNLTSTSYTIAEDGTVTP